jgi:drug/metabolite transporter (DMT)-like permease
MTPGANRLAAYACLALSMSLVGSYVALSKPMVAAIPVFLLAWLRFGIGGLAMLHWLRRPANEAPMTAHTRGLVFLESFLGNFLFSMCMLFGVSMTSAVSAGVIMAAIPAVVALLSWMFLHERIAPRTWTAKPAPLWGSACWPWRNPRLLAMRPTARLRRRTRRRLGWATCWCSAQWCARPRTR